MIEIHYKLRSGETPQRLVLAPEEYFGPLEEGETYEENGTPRYVHCEEYLGLEPRVLEWTRKIVASGGHITTTIERFSADGLTRMGHRRDPGGGGELCVETLISRGCYHLVRLHLDEAEDWVWSYVGIIEDMSDGSRSEVKIVPYRS
jgi:hypothetical protein